MTTKCEKFKKYDICDTAVKNKLGRCYYSSKEKLCKPINYNMDKPIKGYKYLIGPISYREYYSKEYNKHVILIGDYHVIGDICPDTSNKDNTINIFELLLMTFKNTNEKIDFFIESAFQRKGYYTITKEKDSYLENINNLFQNCLRIDKKECPLRDKVNFHYVDVRSHILLTAPDVAYVDPSQIQRYKLRVKQFSTLSETSEGFVNKIKEIYKIDRGLRYIEDEDIREVLSEYFDDAIETYYNNTIDSFKNISNNIDDPEYDFSLDQKIIRSNSIYYTVIMDYYAMVRMFRYFNNDEKNTSRKIITYFGEAHNLRIGEFLEMFNFQLIRDITGVTKEGVVGFQCLNIDGLELPLFEGKIPE